MDQNLAKRLLKAGHMTQDTYNKAFGAGVLPIPPQLDAEGAMRSQAEVDRRADQQKLLEQHRKGVAQMEVLQAEKNRQAGLADLEAKKAGIEQRRQFAEQAGLSKKDIASRLDPELQEIEKQSQALSLTPNLKDRAQTDEAAEGALRLATDIPMVAPTTQVAPSNLYTAGKALDDQKTHIEQLGKIEEAKLKAQTNLQRSQRDEIQRMNQADVKAAQDYQNKMNDVLNKIETTISETAALRVDPNRFWKKSDTQSKIIMGISMFLGGLGAARSGVNSAVSVIERAIDRDIDAQKAAIAQKSQRLSSQQGLLAGMGNVFKNDVARRQLTKAAYLDNAQREIDIAQGAMGYNEPNVKAQLLKDQLEEKKQIAIQQAKQAGAIEYIRPTTPDQDIGSMTEKQAARHVEGYGAALTPKLAEELNREVIPTAKDINYYVDELQKFANASFGSSLSPAQKADAQVLVDGLIGKLRVPIAGPGPMSDSEREFLRGFVGNPTDFLSDLYSGRVKAKLQRLKSINENWRENRLKSAGVKTTEQRFNIKPVE